MKKVAVFSGSRSEYGLLKYLLKEIQSSKYTSLNLIVSGSHLVKNYGKSIEEIKKDKIKISKIIKFKFEKNMSEPKNMSENIYIIGHKSPDLDSIAAAISYADYKNKAEKTGISYSILKQVYDRGMAAYKSGHRPGATAQQWAFARVNSFVTKSKGTWGGADKDLAAKVRG